MGKLNPKQERFVEEYLKDLNATQAAIRAGYSAKTAGVQGFDLLKNPKIEAAVATGMAERSMHTKVTAEQVVRELFRLASADMGDFCEWGPNGVQLRPSGELPRELTAAVQEVKQTTRQFGETTVTELSLKLHDKKGALDSLAKHLGMYLDRTKIEGSLTINSFADLVKAVSAGGTGEAVDTGQEKSGA
jgi:phage terminase small subunit